MLVCLLGNVFFLFIFVCLFFCLSGYFECYLLKKLKPMLFMFGFLMLNKNCFNKKVFKSDEHVTSKKAAVTPSGRALAARKDDR